MIKLVGRVRSARVHPAVRSRILIVSQPTVDGVAICVRDLVQAASGDGYEVVVACPIAGDLARWIQQSGAAWVRLEMRRAPHPSDIFAVMRIRRLARQSALVHLHSSKAGVTGRLALASLGRRRPPSIFTPHGWSWLVGGRLAPLYRLVERMLFPVSTIVVAVSSEEKLLGEEVIGRRATRMLVNPNGVDMSRFCPDGPIAERSAEPLLVWVGRLCHQKAPDLAVAALAMMVTPGVHLRIIGEGDRAAIEEQVRALGLTERVELVGFRSDPAPDLRAADVVVVSSRYDGMALVLLEAMACGAAIVATRVAGSSVLVGGAGEVVPVGDSRALSRAIDALLADPERRRALGFSARERVAREYSIQRSVAETLRLWTQLGAPSTVKHPAAEVGSQVASSKEKVD